MWDLWEQEAEEALGAKEKGIMVCVYKAVGQRSVVMIVDVPDHDFFDKLAMGMMPMRRIFEVEEILPLREYEAFAEDVRKRWKG